MNSFAKFGLGTVQFGLDYGISNAVGRPSLEEVSKILALANQAGFGTLDTAPTYGDSEHRIGACEVSKFKFNIVTKTPVFGGEALTKADGEAVYESLKTSLSLMGVSKVHGLLVHHANTFFLSGVEYLTDAFARLKDEGLISKVGVSVYDGVELDRVLDVFEPEIVQAPLNLIDQRLLSSGHLASLKKQGAEIHVRSLYLQGLLLMEPNTLPAFFDPLRENLIRFRRDIEASGLSPLEACLLFANQLDAVDSLLLGVNGVDQLQDIIQAVRNIEDKSFDFSVYAENDSLFLNPANWPQP
ncbi:MAG: aldo/keto reductase [Mariprofundaceae bacterium]|nr:aldo/keto reductase [Mariprofundaceae bacterium]